jgi:type I restriction enzyme R subunit
VAVFGDLIHTYDIRQSQEDKATVPIFYEPRQVRLHLSAEDIDASLKDITDGLEEAEESDLERRKSRWAAQAAAAGKGSRRAARRRSARAFHGSHGHARRQGHGRVHDPRERRPPTRS